MLRRVGRAAPEVRRVDARTEPVTETLVVSDLHLGLKTARPGPILETLAGWRFARLVLLGDVLHDGGFERLCAETWRLVRAVRELAVAGGAEVVWIAGNHDRHLADDIRAVVGLELRESYAWTSGGRRHLAVHGDRFDPTLPSRPPVARLVGLGYGWCMRRLSRDGDWPRRVDRWWSRRSGLHELVAAGATAWARLSGADTVLCGHTHLALARRFAAEPDARPVTYVNAGSWVETRPSFLAVDPHGIRLVHAR
jgi:UDP-2,3-diacylglucosamine pyrophosphatase LpxH